MSMFCFQCEQTAAGKGCTVKGVCGKTAQVATKQDELIAALVTLSRSVVSGQATAQMDRLMLEGLFTTVTNVNFEESTIDTLINAIQEEIATLGPLATYEAAQLWAGDKDVVSLRSTLLFGLKGMSAYAHHAYVLGQQNPAVTAWFYYGLAQLSVDHTVPEWLQLLMELGQINLKCMALLDQANTSAYGTPVPTGVTCTIEAGPFILVTGHDFHDLAMLLEQTDGLGVNIYTHSEMLPAHGYPELKKYSHLKGNFGTAWNNQQKEFDGLPAPILYTTNCIMPPKDSYAGQIYTTSVVQYPGTNHITADSTGHKDFSPVIQHAIALGGYPTAQARTGLNGGTTMTTGFAHGAVLLVADKVIDAVKSGAISHFFLVGGCDGSKPGRNYYTDFVKQAPSDSIILTLACGKYRFNDLDLGTIGGLPRIMDMGQCNDAYSAIKVAVALAEAFGCGVNELPLTLVLSWYEQKAVCILLTLLSLGIKNIYIGPSIPAFFSNTVLGVLVDQFQLNPITTPEQDLAKMLKK